MLQGKRVPLIVRESNRVENNSRGLLEVVLPLVIQSKKAEGKRWERRWDRDINVDVWIRVGISVVRARARRSRGGLRCLEMGAA